MKGRSVTKAVLDEVERYSVDQPRQMVKVPEIEGIANPHILVPLEIFHAMAGIVRAGIIDLVTKGMGFEVVDRRIVLYPTRKPA